MKRAFFVLWIAILIAGCGEGPLGKGALNGLDNGPGDETGGLFGEQPGSSGDGIPIEDDAATGEEKPAAPKPKVQPIIKPVEITKTGGSLGTCVIGEVCEKRISAKGGSGEYVWTLVEGNLPKGLELAGTETQKVKVKNIDGQEIGEVGEFTFKLRVEDEADAERSAERKFTLRVNEDLAMNLYTIAVNENGTKQWVAVQERDENGGDVPIKVPPKGKLLAVVIGHADSYRWSIGGLEITCSAESCAGENDNIKLYKDTALEPQNLPLHHQSIIVEAKEDFIGQAAQNVVISAAQDYGDPVSKTISSITFQQEPCKIEMKLTGQTAATTKRGEAYELAFTVSGGQAPYRWFRTGSGENSEDSAPDQVEGTNFSVRGTVPSDADITEPITFNVLVQDSCPDGTQHSARLPVTVSIDYPPLSAEKVGDLRLWAHLWTEYTDDETGVRFTVYIRNDAVASNDTRLNGDDPDHWKQHFPLSIASGFKDASVEDITEVAMTMYDNPDAWADLEWEAKHFYLIGKHYYAVDMTGDGGNEVDGESDTLHYLFSKTPGDEPDLRNYMDLENGLIWRPCPKADGCIDPS